MEVVRLRECWCRLRSDVCAVFRLVMDSAWNDSNRERPDLSSGTKALVSELCARDPHTLNLKIDEIVRRFAAEVRFVTIYRVLIQYSFSLKPWS